MNEKDKDEDDATNFTQSILKLPAASSLGCSWYF